MIEFIRLIYLIHLIHGNVHSPANVHMDTLNTDKVSVVMSRGPFY